MTIDKAAMLKKAVFFSGTGFGPGTDIVVTFDGPGEGTNDFVFPEPDPGRIHGPTLLQVGDDGAFGPWDVTFTEPTEAGDWLIAFSDGDCEAQLAVTVAAS